MLNKIKKIYIMTIERKYNGISYIIVYWSKRDEMNEFLTWRKTKMRAYDKSRLLLNRLGAF